jgi:hypothetical protein
MRAIAFEYVAITMFGRRVMENQTVRASPSESARPVHAAAQPMTYVSLQD